MKRIWNVRLNVDEWNSGIAGLDDDSDRIKFLAGFNAGLNGKEMMPKGEAWEAGWKVGNSSHLEAIKYSEKQRARVMNRYHGSTTVEPWKNHGSTTELPNDNLQSTIYNPTNEQTTNELARADVQAPVSQGIKQPDDFQEFWNLYGKKVTKVQTQAKWKSMSQADRERAIAGIPGYHASKPDPQFRVDPIRYLNRRLWEDEVVQEVHGTSEPVQPKSTWQPPTLNWDA